MRIFAFLVMVLVLGTGSRLEAINHRDEEQKINADHQVTVGENTDNSWFEKTCDLQLKSNRSNFHIITASSAPGVTEENMENEKSGLSLGEIILGIAEMTVILGADAGHNVGEHETDAYILDQRSQQLEQRITVADNKNIITHANDANEHLQEQACDTILIGSRINLMANINSFNSSLPGLTVHSDLGLTRLEADSVRHQTGQRSNDGMNITQVFSDDHSFCTTSHEKSCNDSIDNVAISDVKEGMKHFVVEKTSPLFNKTKTKKVVFDLPLSSQEESNEGASFSHSVSRRLQKEASLETASKVEFEKCSKRFKGILRSVTQAIDEITEGTEISIPSAALYAAAYPKARTCLQALLSMTKNDVSLQDKKRAIQLANAAIEVIGIAAKTVAPENLEPIPLKGTSSYLSIGGSKKPFNLAYKNIGFNEKVDPLDMEVQIVIGTAESAIKNLQEIRDVLAKTDADVGTALLQSQINRVSRVHWFARKESSVLSAKRAILRTQYPNYDNFLAASVQIRSEDVKLGQFVLECRARLRAIQNSLPADDPIEVTRIAIIDLLAIMEQALKAADNMAAVLFSRKIPT